MSQTEPNKKFAQVGVVGGCLIEKDGKYLMVQEDKEEVRGKWNLPAGQIDEGETIEEGAVREAKEESGYDVKLGEKIGLYHESIDSKVIHVFRAEITGGELTSQEGEILDAKWFTYDEISRLNDENKLRAPFIWDVIQKTCLAL